MRRWATFREDVPAQRDLAESFGSRGGRFWYKRETNEGLPSNPEMAGVFGKRRVLRGLLSGGLFGAIEVIGHFLWPSVFSGSLSGFFVSAIIFAFVSMSFDVRKFDYKVFVSDDSITTVHFRFQRSVRKNEVKRSSNPEVTFCPHLHFAFQNTVGSELGFGAESGFPKHYLNAPLLGTLH